MNQFVNSIGVLFHRADYNLVATTTKTPAPRRMTCLTL